MTGSTGTEVTDEVPAAEPQLFVVFLGGDLANGRMGEDHEVVFVAATDLKAARTAAKRKWGGSGRAHIDAVAAVDSVDGYHVQLVPTAEGDGDQVAVDNTYVR